MRLFFGAFTPPDLIREVQKISDWLKTVPGKVVELKNLHFTLIFLGNVSPEQSKDITRVGESVAAKSKPLKLNTLGFQLIPSERSPKVLAIKTKPSATFKNLQQRLLDESTAVGLFNINANPPHLTLARLRSYMSLPTITFPSLNLTITEFSLIESTLSSTGPAYKTLGNFQLGKNNQEYRSSVGICLYNDKNEVLLVKNSIFPGEHWQTPQGGLENGERPDQTAVRELAEETHVSTARLIKTSDNKYSHLYKNNSPENIYAGQEFTTVFMKVDGRPEVILDREEATDFKWVSIDDVIKSVAKPRREYMTMVINELKSIIKNHDQS